MAIYQLGDISPEIDASAYITDSAKIIGKVKIDANNRFFIKFSIYQTTY